MTQQEAELNIEIEITKLVGVLAACFPTVQMSASSVNAYVSMLKDIPREVLRATVEQCIAESEFLPTIARLRDKAFLLMSDVAHLPTPFEAWGIVIQEVRRTGFYRSPKFEQALIARAVECIGWQELCMSENHVADRAHFVKVYEALVRRAIQDAKALPSARLLQEAAGRRSIALEGAY